MEPDETAKAEPSVAASRSSRASGYRPYRPLREERPVSPPHSPAPAVAQHAEPVGPEPTVRPEPPRQPALARQLDESAEIIDEEFWAYIRNEVGR
ncbi:hypothetical protein AB0C02_21415 [Micromonospora sp. NPDC048999]|uniref:hypothetical protein n=1 Tax=Micromonospora sp. NPDC048999 TaxID=3155391 RepID=UPI0033E86336